MTGGSASTWGSLGLALGEEVELSVVGDCMHGVDDGTRVRAVRRRLYVPGDVVVVRRMDHWNVHRFLGYLPTRDGLAVVTKADDSIAHDPLALANRVVGRVEEMRVTPLERAAAFCFFVSAVVRQMRR